MNNMMKKISSICLALLITLSFIPVIGMQEAFAEGKNAGTITLDLTQGNVSLSGDKLDAFNNVMQELHSDGIIYIMKFGDYIYNLDNDKYNTYEIGRKDHAEYSEFYMRDNVSFTGEWSQPIDASIQNKLKEANKNYCERVVVVIPEVYNIWVEGVQLNKTTAADIKGDKTAVYDDQTKTLTLNGATLKIKSTDSISWTAVKTYEELNLKLIGTNNIIQDGNPEAEFAIGIDAEKLNVSGPGSLEINIDTDKKCYGISSGDLTIDGAKITSNVKTEPRKIAYGVAATNNNIELKNGAVLKAVSYTDSVNAEGVKADGLSVSENSILEALADGAAVDAANIDDATKARSAWVNDAADATGASAWNKTSSLSDFKYVRMPLNHVHLWVEGEITKQPTCTETGIRTLVCTACGETTTETIASKGHDYGAWTTTKAATELAAGTETKTCSLCGDRQTRTVKKLAPSLKAVKIAKPAAAKKSATIKWKKVAKKNLKKIKKVQIQYSPYKKFNKGVKTKYANAKKTSLKIKGLKSKKTYYVRVRAYTKSGKTVHISKWSAVKKVKIK